MVVVGLHEVSNVAAGPARHTSLGSMIRVLRSWLGFGLLFSSLNMHQLVNAFACLEVVRLRPRPALLSIGSYIYWSVKTAYVDLALPYRTREFRTRRTGSSAR